MPTFPFSLISSHMKIISRSPQTKILMAILLFGSTCVVQADIPIPQIQGPLAVSEASYPFGAADHTLLPQALSEFDYVEEEFLVSGEANVYDWPALDRLSIRSANAPYTTRVLVRRPANEADFSGNIVVEMLNPSNLFDLNIGWAISHTQMIRNGDAWVGITAKPISVVTLQQFDAERYAALSWANPLPASDPQNCETSSRDTVQATENGLVWDIHSQVAVWLRSGESSNPFTYGGTKSAADKLYGWGYSQTGGFLYTYINAFHNRDSEEYGADLFDGYIVAVSTGPTPINQCAERFGREDPRSPIRNAGVPVIHIMSQSDYLLGMAARQPDSEQFRHYEIAGSGHASPDELYWGAAPEDLIKAGRDVPPLSCNEGERSRFPNSLAFNAALAGLDGWVRLGIAPPRAELIQVVDGQPVLDVHGNVIGGLRSPMVDVPLSTWNGNSSGQSFCRIAGHEIPFSEEKIRALYGSHDNYVGAVTESVRQLVADKFLMAADGEKLIAEAKERPFP